jgi:hypothetical protein
MGDNPAAVNKYYYYNILMGKLDGCIACVIFVHNLFQP